GRWRRPALLRHGPRADDQTPGLTAGALACPLATPAVVAAPRRSARGVAPPHGGVEAAGGADACLRGSPASIPPARHCRRRVRGGAQLRAGGRPVRVDRRRLPYLPPRDDERQPRKLLGALVIGMEL